MTVEESSDASMPMTCSTAKMRFNNEEEQKLSVDRLYYAKIHYIKPQLKAYLEKKEFRLKSHRQNRRKKSKVN